MQNHSVFDPDLTELTQVNKQILRIFRNDFLHLFKDVIHYDFSGLLLYLSQLRNRDDVDLDGGVGEIDFILHLHRVLDQELFSQTDDDFL